MIKNKIICKSKIKFNNWCWVLALIWMYYAISLEAAFSYNGNYVCTRIFRNIGLLDVEHAVLKNCADSIGPQILSSNFLIFFAITLLLIILLSIILSIASKKKDKLQLVYVDFREISYLSNKTQFFYKYFWVVVLFWMFISMLVLNLNFFSDKSICEGWIAKTNFSKISADYTHNCRVEVSYYLKNYARNSMLLLSHMFLLIISIRLSKLVRKN